MKDWSYITSLIGNQAVSIERIRIRDMDVAIEGEFELPPLARLPSDDQVFVAVFVQCHGSIKKMEQYFGISYPTVKNRLAKIVASMDFAAIKPAGELVDQTLSRLEAGEIDVNESIDILAARKRNS
ncbi:MAG: DUF2089 domain-containing protein [Gammaproteobacteria bacterium]|nr:DUF2089 domain-containing protein [Gammaproteobacteria bacterium]